MGWGMGFLVSEKVKKQAATLVENLGRALSGKVPGNKRDTQKVEQALQDFYAAVQRVVVEQKLGIFRRATLAYTIQQSLLANGLPADVVSKVMSALVMNLLGRRKAG